MTHYRQCTIKNGGVCVCEEIRLLDLSPWDLYTQQELDEQRIKGRKEGSLLTLLSLVPIIVAIFLALR